MQFASFPSSLELRHPYIAEEQTGKEREDENNWEAVVMQFLGDLEALWWGRGICECYAFVHIIIPQFRRTLVAVKDMQ